MDLLLNPARFAWAVNCEILEGEEQDSLRIGALFLEPSIPTPIIRFTHNEQHLDVELPGQYLRVSYAQRAWNITLPIVRV